MQAFTPFVQVTTYATRHFATLGLAHAAANHFFSLCTPVMRRGVCDVSPVIAVLVMAMVMDRRVGDPVGDPGLCDGHLFAHFFCSQHTGDWMAIFWSQLLGSALVCCAGA